MKSYHLTHTPPRCLHSPRQPLLSENERRRLAQNMDMQQVSIEYERELRRPIRSLLSGQIAKLVLIQV